MVFSECLDFFCHGLSLIKGEDRFIGIPVRDKKRSHAYRENTCKKNCVGELQPAPKSPENPLNHGICLVP